MNLLLLACSQAKRPEAGDLPAYQRYDGPTYRVLRAWMRQTPDWQGVLRIRILSAEYGLIGPFRPIPAYDRLMTRARAMEVQADVAKELELLLLAHPSFDQALISLGATYWVALPTPLPFTYTAATGRPGERLQRLKAWLGEVGQ